MPRSSLTNGPPAQTSITARSSCGAAGRGWQTRMDEALKKYLAARQR
jgi:hypothetical protein